MTLSSNENTRNQLPVDPSRRRFCRTTAGGVVLAATGLGLLQGCSSAAVPDTAISAWLQEPQYTDVSRWALSYAILAPNPHNLQPWLFDLSNENEIVVSIDPERVLPETDPFGRQIIIGTGAMIGLLELAAATRGFTVEKEWIGEEANDAQSMMPLNQPIVRLRLVKATSEVERGLRSEMFAQIPRRHTVRGDYDPARMPGAEFIADMPELTLASQSAGVLSSADSTADFAKVSDWVKEGWRIELATPQTQMESIRLLRVGSREIEKHRDGIVIDSPFLVMLSKLGLMDRSKPMEPGSRNFNGQIDSFNAAVDSTPGWLWLSSDDNSRLAQLDVGISYVQMQLLATAHGLVMHPVSQGLQEYAEINTIYTSMQSFFSNVSEKPGQTLQMLARIGYLPADSDAPQPAPRRGLAAHLTS